MIKIILIMIALSCSKGINELRNINKGIIEDLIRYYKNKDQEKVLELLKNNADVNFKDIEGNTALFYAICCGWEEGMKILVEYGADVNIKNNYGVDPLFCALYCSSLTNRAKIMEKLIEYGANFNAKRDDGHNLLVSAACRGEIKVIKLLLNKGANVNYKTNGYSALIEGIKHKNLKIIDILLKVGAECGDEEREKINQLIKEKNDINFVNEKGETALLIASSNGELKLAKSLIERGANVNVKDMEGKSPFTRAVLHGSRKTVKLLLDNGADISERINNNSALFIALDKRNFKLAKLLIEYGANIEERSNLYRKTVLMYATEKNCIEIVKMLMKINSDANNTNDLHEALNCAATLGNLEIMKLLWEKLGDFKKYGEEALLASSFMGYIDIVKWLIEEGTDPNIEINIRNFNYSNITPQNSEPFSITPLIVVAKKSHTLETGKFLIEKGADINRKNSLNFTPLMSASKNGNLELVKLLLKLDVDINSKDNYGKTAIFYAITNKHTEIAKILLEKNINVNEKNMEGITLLIQAATIGDREIVESLICKGADISNKDNSGMTALMHASTKGHLEVVKLLVEHRADINEKSRALSTAIMYSISMGHLETVNFLLERGANLTSMDKYYGENVLFYVVNKGYLEILKILLNKFKELNLDLKNTEGDTLLLLAVLKGNTKIVELLIEKGSNINYKNSRKKRSVFSLSLEKKNLEIISLLVEKNINISEEDVSALINLMEQDEKLTKNLIGKGIDIYNKDKNGKSLLMYLSEKIKNYDEWHKKDICIKMAYVIIKKMTDDYIKLFVSLNKSSNILQESKAEMSNHINLLYSLQRLPKELFMEVIKQF